MNKMLLVFSATCIFVLGLVMIFSTTSADVLDHGSDRNTHQELLKQIAYACAGCLLGWAAWKAGYRSFIQWSPIFLAVLTFFLILVLIPGIGREVNGSKRWISIAGLSFQPSEFVKYVLPAFFIYQYHHFEGEIKTFKDLIRLIGIAGVPLFLIMIEPNNGTTGVIGLSLLVLFLLTRIPFKFWAWPLLGCVLIGGVFAYNLPYVNARIKVYLNPELDLKGKGHQPYQAKIAAGSGGMFGQGPGNSLQKLSYLPEAQNDYIAAIFAEEFGFFGMLGLIILYMLFAYAGFSIAYSVQDKQGFYFAAAITFLITFQAFLNLGVVSGLLPSTGLNLPLFSQGGTSLLANLMGMGLLLGIK